MAKLQGTLKMRSLLKFTSLNGWEKSDFIDGTSPFFFMSGSGVRHRKYNP